MDPLLDPTLPDVPLTLGGELRQLAFDFRAIIVAEKETGLNLMKAASFAELSFTQVRGLLYAALLKHDPKLQLSTLDGWINMRNLFVIQNAIAEAWFGSLPTPKDDAAGEAEAQTTV